MHISAATMSSQQSSRNHSHSSTVSAASSSYYYYYAQTTTTQPTWMTVIPIEDDDLTFGGKPLSDWYEEDRRRYSPETEAVMPEAQVHEARGRTRQRAACEPAPAHHHGGHHHHKHHHHKTSDKK